MHTAKSLFARSHRIGYIAPQALINNLIPLPLLSDPLTLSFPCLRGTATGGVDERVGMTTRNPRSRRVDKKMCVGRLPACGRRSLARHQLGGGRGGEKHAEIHTRVLWSPPDKARGSSRAQPRPARRRRSRAPSDGGGGERGCDARRGLGGNMPFDARSPYTRTSEAAENPARARASP